MRKMIATWILLSGFNVLFCYGQEKGIQAVTARNEGYTPSNNSVKQLKDALRQIQEIYKVNLLFETKLETLTTSSRINPEKDLDLVLRELLTPLMLKHVKLNDRNYVIKSAQAPTVTSGRPVAEPDFSQKLPNVIEKVVSKNDIPPVEVKGSVTDENGKPVAGATVLVKGTYIVTISDNAGNFTIRIPEDRQPVLMISHISMDKQEINVKNKSYIRVSMARSERQGDEVVVVGYGKQKKKDVVTAVSTINADDLVQINTPNLGNALQGKVNGAIIVSRGGVPGKDRPFIMIRGNNPNTPPLIVIDGVPRYQDLGSTTSGINLNGLTLDDINPDEVESVSILKDNAATAVYGVRGAYGVVLITTKRGKIGKPQFSFSTNYSEDHPSRFPKLLDNYHWAMAQNENAKNNNPTAAVPYNDSILNVIKNNLDPYTYATDNNYDMMVQRKATTQSNSLSVSGGTDQVRYYINGSATFQKSILKAFDYQRYTIQSNVDIKLHRDIKLAINTGFVNARIGTASGGTNGDGVFANMLTFVTSPLTPIFNRDGSLYANGPNGNRWANTVPDLSGYRLNRNNNISVQANLEYTPLSVPGLTFRVNNNINYNAADFKEFYKYYDAYKPDSRSPTGYTKTSGTGAQPNTLTETIGNATAYNSEIGFDYTRKFKQHRVNLTALGTKSYRTALQTMVKRDGILANLETISSGRALNQETGGSETESGKVGGVTRLNYDFKSKYYLEFSMRADASDNFPPGQKWGYFPGGAVSWRISDEKFVKQNLPFVQDLKFRASMGLTGIDNLSAYSYYYNYTIATTGTNSNGQAGYAFGNVYQPSFILANKNIPNKDVTWGKSMMRNIGMDFSLWKGLLSGSFDIYDKNLYDLQRSRDLTTPATLGILGPSLNFAKEFYSGYEGSLANNLKFGKDISLQTAFNFSYNYSRVVDYGEPANTTIDKKKQGNSISSLTFYKAVGIFQTQDEINKYPVYQDASRNSTIKPGDIKYADLNGDSLITTLDQVIINNVNLPPVSGGLNITFRYKTFSVNAFFQGVLGNYVNFVPSLNTEYGYNNSWRNDSTAAIYPRISTAVNNSKRSTLYMQNGDYVRFKNLRFAYSLPGRFLKNTGLSNVALSVAATNLTAISKIKDIDPEAANTNANNGGYFPIQRNYSVGLNIGL